MSVHRPQLHTCNVLYPVFCCADGLRAYTGSLRSILNVYCSGLSKTVIKPAAVIIWVNEMRYLGVHIIRSQVFKCNIRDAKR